MENSWKKLSRVGKFWLVMAVFAIVLILGWLRLIYSLTTTNDVIIFDYSRQEIVPEVSFWDWLLFEDRYTILKEEFTLVGSVNNVAYRAILRLPRNNHSVKKFLPDASPGHSKFWQELESAVSRCAGEAVRRDYKVEGYPSITVRTMSINNMNELCPLAQEYGYQWQGALEIAQCPDLPKDNFQQQSCEDKVRYAKY